jgi:hypothetical protein
MKIAPPIRKTIFIDRDTTASVIATHIYHGIATEDPDATLPLTPELLRIAKPHISVPKRRERQQPLNPAEAPNNPTT